MFRKFRLSAVLLFLIALLVIPSAAAFTPDDVLYNHDAVEAWDIRFDAWYLIYSPNELLSSSFIELCWKGFDRSVSAAGYGRLRSYDSLTRAVSNFNSQINSSLPGSLTAAAANGFKSPEAVIQFDSHLGAYVLVDKVTGIHIVSSDGRYPYYVPDQKDPVTGEDAPDRSLGGKWVRIDKVNWNRTHILSEYSFYDIGYALRDYGEDNEVDVRYVDDKPTYEYLVSRERYENGIPFVYCDKDGQPYVNRPDPEAWAQEQDNNWIIDDAGNTIKGQLIDVDTNTVWFPDGTLNFINNLVYDESTKTYYVDASTSYDIENNVYNTYNYHYEYHIDYTSITYIGQTSEYDEVYEYYYQLPDGRSSADLTVEELQALNTQIDVLPYFRSADDTSIRALYHFDGDIRDSSYWSYLGELKWNKGASITYMDVGAFNGALYLDENEHDFTITLPSGLGSGDFTVQFRYYQSHTLTPQTDSYFMIGAANLLQFDGASVKDASGNTLSAVSVGNWIELALMRKDGVLTYFLNGVPIGSASYVSSFGKDLRFIFGDQQETYKYFDELRVLNKAVYSTSGYSPTSVPHDTNLALVLPDSIIPVADEYWSITSSHENMLTQYGLDWCTELVTAGNSYFYQNDKSPSFNALGVNGIVANTSGYIKFPVWGWDPVLTDLTVDGGFSLMSKPFGSGNYTFPIYQVYPSNNTANIFPTYGLITSLGYSGSLIDESMRGKSYTFSVVTENGAVTSLTFTIPSLIKNFKAVSVDGGGYHLATYVRKFSDNYYTYLAIQPLEFNVPTPKIMYMELVEGSSTDLTAEFVSSVVAMDKDDLNTPSLAVRTDLDITGYQIGGVRPSLPEKGLVWAMVENSRITSLQVYNGQAWEEVDGRIWTGSRWVPYYAYDVLLLKDMWDIVEADPSLNPIYTEVGFWTWLQGAWKDMIARLDKLISLSGGSAGDPSSDPTILPGVEDDPLTPEDEGWQFIDLVVVVKDGVWAIVSGVVRVGAGGLSVLADGVSSIGGFFDAYDPSVPGGVLDILTVGSDVVWD